MVGQQLPAWGRALTVESLCLHRRDCGLHALYEYGVPEASYRIPACFACLMEEQVRRGELPACYAAPARNPGTVYTLVALQRLFQFTCIRPLRPWRERGWLADLTYGSLLRFLRNPDTWMAWEPGNLTDPELREWTQALRAAHPWRWLTLYEVADRLGYTLSGVVTIIKTAKKDPLRAIRYQSRYYVRSDEVERWARDVMPHRHPGPEARYQDPMVEMGIRLPAPYRDGLMRLGDGNIAEGVRRLYEMYQADIQCVDEGAA